MLKILSAAEQTAAYIREEIGRGHWVGTIPGTLKLAEELGVNHKTVDEALRQLEHNGVLQAQGVGRQRRIVQTKKVNARKLRVGVLFYEPGDQLRQYLAHVTDALAIAGHSSFLAEKCLTELNMDVGRVSRLIKKTPADAWVVMAGSRDVLRWFVDHKLPTFALFGRREGLPIPCFGPDFRAAAVEAVRHLAGLGHRRIIMISRTERRLPEPGPPERAFLDELKAHGLPVGDYNLPDWKDNAEGLRALLDSLYSRTPPTALIIDDVHIYVAVGSYLARRGILAPERVSLICTETSPELEWCMPGISHFQWNRNAIVPHIVRWAEAVSRGRKYLTQFLVPAKFVPAGSTGPVPK